MKVRALRAHPYWGENYKRGQEYEISRPKDLKLLVAIKAVEVVEEPTFPVARAKERKVAAASEGKAEKKKNYSRKDLHAEPAEEGKPKEKRTYSRSDLSADPDDHSESPSSEE